MHRLFILITLTLAAAACRERAPSTTLSDDQFIEVVVALRSEATALTGDSLGYVTARERILAEQNVTYDDLKQYVEVRSRDLARYARVWEVINRELAPDRPH